ncbi:type 2 lanthipeptide synthetase LanM family protein [Labedaea rhizosphaerae]|uniref:Type 2 lantibiotic biosynthesis protein LanM n=1 Tax=Labedaea rhizosphaerae TaxID=598644 RepID=A0A4R6SAE9_LABRH|nr:type 2 lanthipeptide synthetase LanM family protein [Labedaea rhizosphaerae]TDP96494.1 type 2 lantibiotic biosynthesis protein LanM [Labedaea rhizosphaerae]
MTPQRHSPQESGRLAADWWLPALARHERPSIGRPAWVDVVEQAVANANRTADLLPEPPADPADWRAALTVPLRPFVAGTVDRIIGSGHDADVDLASVAAAVADRLTGKLTRIARRTLVHEANASGSPLPEFVAALASPDGLADLVGRYPVLGRLLGQAAMFASDAVVELLDRLAADRTAIADELLSTDPGRCVAVDTGLADSHDHGRSVAVLTFADGARVVYKPRDVAAHVRFTELVDWLNERLPLLPIRTAKALPRNGYGWVEFVESAPTTVEGVARFHRRAGALLALLHAVRATDVHFENLIAAGDQPVLIDTETLFQPARTGTDLDPAAAGLAKSVYSTGMLPMLAVGDLGAADISGLGAAPDTPAQRTVVDWTMADSGELAITRRPGKFAVAANRPHVDGTPAEPAEHAAELLAGFHEAYDTILADRDDFAALLSTCDDVEVRVVLRPTQGYVTLLDESTHPTLLADALDRDQALEVLWRRDTGNGVAEAELTALWAGDVPVFHTRPGATDLWSAGRRLPDQLIEPGLTSTRTALAEFSDADRRAQEWITAAALATRAVPDHTDRTTRPGDLAGIAATTDRLLATASAIADQLLARSFTNGERVNWLGIEALEDAHFALLPMGAGLAEGYPGVALFLAELHAVSGVARYAEVARRAVVAVPDLLAGLEKRPDLVAAVGCGGLAGLAGTAYALARLATLLSDVDIAEQARRCAALAGIAANATTAPDLATGHAGYVAAISAVATELGAPELLDQVGAVADQLAELVISTDGDGSGTDLPPGFANGLAGLAWTLATYAQRAGTRQHAAAARLAMHTVLNARRETSADRGWCAGTAGQVIAMTAALPSTVDIEAAVQGLTDGPLLRNLGLCHGELGVVEALTALGDHPVAVAARRTRAGQILDAITSYGEPYGQFTTVATPSLCTGSAGVGHGLLRLAFPDRVPTPLLWQPTNDH